MPVVTHGASRQEDTKLSADRQNKGQDRKYVRHTEGIISDRKARAEGALFIPVVLLQFHVKDPGHSAKSTGGRLKLNTHTPYLCGFERSNVVHGRMVYIQNLS